MAFTWPVSLSHIWRLTHLMNLLAALTRAECVGRLRELMFGTLHILMLIVLFVLVGCVMAAAPRLLFVHSPSLLSVHLTLLATARTMDQISLNPIRLQQSRRRLQTILLRLRGLKVLRLPHSTPL